MFSGVPTSVRFLLCLALFQPISPTTVGPLRVGIIGAGAGGSSAAYYLSKLLGPKVKVDVYEERSVVGGRLATANILGNEYETGGSVIHPKNRLAVDLAATFGLVQRPDSSSSITSFLKDGEIAFSTSSWTLVTILKILHRYGFDFNRLQSMTGHFISEFESIYRLQADGEAFESTESMILAMGPSLLNLTKSDFYSYLLDQGYSSLFVDELVQGITYVNYGQNTSTLHSLVGSVSVAGASDGLWSVLGGNRRLPMALLNSSNVNLKLNTRIGSVVSLPSGAFRFSSDSGGKKLLPEIYDQVILAHPFSSQAPVQFNNFVDRAGLDSLSSKYHRTVTTIVAAKAVREKYKTWLDIIACTPNFFTSISRVHPVVLNRSERVPVFKIFSPEPLTDAQLHDIFEDIHQIDISDWLAYPAYNGPAPPLPSFIPAPNVYHLNGIEWAASAIEMSLISGRNAALHISKQISGAQRKTEGEDLGSTSSRPGVKTEL